MKWPDASVRDEPAPISVELITEESPPVHESQKSLPAQPPPQFRESGADPDLAPGRVPEASKLDERPTDAPTKRLDEAVVQPPPARVDPVSGLEVPSRKPSPKLVKPPPATKNIESPTDSKFGAGEGGGDRYLNLIRDQIEKQRVYPAVAGPMQLSGTASYEVWLRRSGEIERVRMTKSTGAGILDTEGLGMIRRAAPFPPVPLDLPGDLIRLDLVMYIGPRRQ